MLSFSQVKCNTNWVLKGPFHGQGKDHGGLLPKELGGVWSPASQNPCTIYDQNLRFSLPYLSLLMT